MRKYIENYLGEMMTIIQAILATQIDSIVHMVAHLKAVKEEGGRVFLIGVGGGAGTGSHAANDFNKIAGIPAICLTDNPSLFSALANDEGFDSVFVRQMEMHRFNRHDCLFVFSVGGGSDSVSNNIADAVLMARRGRAVILGVVGRDTGHTAKYADAAVVIPIVAEERVTPHSESFQLAIEHMVVNALASDGEI